MTEHVGTIADSGCCIAEITERCKAIILQLKKKSEGHVSSLQSTSVTQSCPTLCNPWMAARQVSLSITSSRRLLKLMSIEAVMPSNHLILCHPLLLLPSIFPRIRVFSSKSVIRISWPKYWSFSFNISLYNEYSGLISF